MFRFPSLLIRTALKENPIQEIPSVLNQSAVLFLPRENQKYKLSSHQRARRSSTTTYPVLLRENLELSALMLRVLVMYCPILSTYKVWCRHYSHQVSKRSHSETCL